MSLLIFPFWSTTALTYLEKWLKVAQTKALEMRPKYRRNEEQSSISQGYLVQIFSPVLKNKKNLPPKISFTPGKLKFLTLILKNFLNFRKLKPRKNFLFFLKRKLFLYFGKRKLQKKHFYVSVIFREVTFRDRKVKRTHSEKMLYFSGN